MATILDNSKLKKDRLQIIVFKQGDEDYALLIDQIKEVVITPEITKMPENPNYIKGIVNVRGCIYSILDLEEMFNLKRTNKSNDMKNYSLLMESGNIKIGLLVRDLPNTITISTSDLDESLSKINSSGVDSSYIQGTIKSHSRLIILLDIFKLVNNDLLNHLKKTVDI